MPSTLGYWNIRGLGQAIRFMLHYVGEEYEEKYQYYQPGQTLAEIRGAWYEMKPKMGLDFPNLPYYKDGKVTLTHHLAILRYLGRKYNMGGTTEQEKLNIDLVSEEYMDLLRDFILGLCFNPDFEKLKDSMRPTFLQKLEQLDKFLGTNPWFAGPDITWVDFVVFETIYQIRMLWEDCLDHCPQLASFRQRFLDLPQVKAFIADKTYIAWPMYPHIAQFGGK